MSKSKVQELLDPFAQIAAQRSTFQKQSLIIPAPPPRPKKSLPVGPHDPKAAFRPAVRIDSDEKLQAELKRLRRLHAPFLRNLAPPLKLTRLAVALETFDWRIESEQDRRDFPSVLAGGGQWEQAHIPHYGPPLGRAATCYRTAFTLSDEMMSRGAIFACFGGADYKAQVFVNGALVGCHEGFFAPFEFDITACCHAGENVLLVRLENDAIVMGNNSWGDDGHKYEGDKLYAATGPGYDEPLVGWHHCPPAMGLYQGVRIEARATVHVHDIFVRPLAEKGRAEAWIEVWNCSKERQEIAVELSVFGLNFRKTVFRNHRSPARQVGPSVNYFRLDVEIPAARSWEPDAPWLYQLQVSVIDDQGRCLDAAARQFGMRTFRMDEEGKPKGRLLLNGREIRLRGANTMGFEQQDVMRGDWNQLIDDILLTKICHMNFWRLTQRPVQPEVYDYCDRLGLLTQTDLPLFAHLRRNQFCEAVRQAEEMERLVRSHPCNIMISYINEPSPGKWRDKTHRHLTRPELESFFIAADQAVRLANPDRVIKAVDGDYDPPAPGLPDNHCYCGWYSGHGVDMGRLNRGHWQAVKPGWLYGCGEFGSEGLECEQTMREHYPPSWLPRNAEEDAAWTPTRIVKAQTGLFHYMWFDTQHSLADWIAASQAHQAWTTRLMTEAFRRDRGMNSFAIHLFIDAFPAGWMKSIMDCRRRGKPAFFAYRDALTPLAANLRTDRYAFFAGEAMALEAWVCNDLADAPKGCMLHYQLECGGRIIAARRAKADVPTMSTRCQGLLPFRAPQVATRTRAIVRLALVDSHGKLLHDTAVELDIFPPPPPTTGRSARIIGPRGGKAAALCKEMGIAPRFSGPVGKEELLLIDGIEGYRHHAAKIVRAVRGGATAVALDLPVGTHKIAGSKVEVRRCDMGPRHFVSRATGHRIVAGFQPNDFRFWFDSAAGCVSPLLRSTFTAPSWRPILASGNIMSQSSTHAMYAQWDQTLAAAELELGRGRVRVCQVALAGRTKSNPVAMLFAQGLLDLTSQDRREP